MPQHPTPPTDPRLAALAARCRSLRVELDRLDDAVEVMHRDDRPRLVAWMHTLRDSLEGLEADIEAMAADGQPR